MNFRLELFMKLLWISKVSFGGNFAFRAEYMKETLKCGIEEVEFDLLNSLTGFLNLLVQGRVPKEVVPFLVGGLLCALLKKGDDVRPVAVGEFTED